MTKRTQKQDQTKVQTIASRATTYLMKLRAVASDKRKVNLEALRREVTAIRTEAVEKLTERIEPTIEALEANGFQVHLVYSLADAYKTLAKLTEGHRYLVKSKSNMVNRVLTGHKLKTAPVETDLGDFVADALKTKDVHPVLPAVGLSAKIIAKKLKKVIGKNVVATPEGIASAVRGYLREKIYKATLGLTGANAITLDGSIVILENEGNISLITRCPDTHVVVAGVEKIVKDLSEATTISHASAVWGTNQYMPSYVNIISGPSKTADIESTTITGAQGAKEVHVILIDTRKALPEEFHTLLQCINCGACLDVCDAYLASDSAGSSSSAGKSQYKGIKYLAEELIDGKPAPDLVFKCSTCKACTEICPAGIPLRDIMIRLREYCVEHETTPKELESMISNIRKTGNPFARKKATLDDKLYCC